MKVAVVPVQLEDHWMLLTIDLKQKQIRFVDTLQKPKLSAVEGLKYFLKTLKTGVKSLDWITEDAVTCRSNYCRQGLDNSCGYYVVWWIEEEFRRHRGEVPFGRGYPNPGDIVKSLLPLMNALIPVEKKLQERLGSRLWLGGGNPAVDPDPPKVEVKEEEVVEENRLITP